MSDNKTKIKSLKISRIAYPSILVLYFLLLISIFVFTVRFLSGNINEAFKSIGKDAMEEKIIAPDLSDYDITAKKLNLKKAGLGNGEATDRTDSGETVPAPPSETGGIMAYPAVTSPAEQD